jgi:hypothetical protein
MKPLGSILVVRMWCGVHTKSILRCFDDTEGMNYGDSARRHGPRALELANSLRLSTIVLSQDLSGAWVTIRG